MAPLIEIDGSDKGTWKEWARHVLLELERLNTGQAGLTDRLQHIGTDLDSKTSGLRQEIQLSLTQMRELNARDSSDLRVELAMLKVKAGLWGAVGAAIPILVTLGVALVVHYATKS